METGSKQINNLLTILRDNDLTIQEEKCTFGANEVNLLSYVMCEQGLKPVSRAAVRDMSSPVTKKEVQRLLGSVGYYKQLIPNYVDIAAIITNLTSSKIKFKWSSK